MGATGTNRLFVDEVIIEVAGGKGGNGCMSFRRELYVPKGGPDGGDGAHGGSVFLEATDSMNTLLDLTGKHHYFAENGEPGFGSNCAGKRGKSMTVRVPVGTLVYDQKSGQLLKDLVDNGERVRVARGGRGGRGNAHFATSTNQAPREVEAGGAGQRRMLRLELKLLADVGLVGMPNAGKSTLLSRLTRAHPKIAAYPFTTTEPHLGMLELPGDRRLILADIPGLIEGAHDGVGLGDAFLRHIERTRMIVHLVDLVPPEGSPTPAEAYRIIHNELGKYSAKLAGGEELIAGNKMDLTGAEEALETLRAEIGKPVYAISGVTGKGIRELGEALWVVVQRVKSDEKSEGPVRFDFDAPAVTSDSDETLIDDDVSEDDDDSVD